MNFKITYHTATPRETECFKCGEKKMCAFYVADTPEPETGNIDEFAVCADCEEILCNRL